MTRVRSKIEHAVNEALGHSRISQVFDQMEWAEEEIKKAIERHPEDKGALYHTFTVLLPTAGLELLSTELLYRAHCVELLNRVAAGSDLRPATSAEMLAVCGEMSERAPLSTGATTLYLRLWNLAFPDKAMEDGVHHEHVAGDEATRLEVEMRRKLRQADRVIRDVNCGGQHWGEPAPECPLRTSP